MLLPEVLETDSIDLKMERSALTREDVPDGDQLGWVLEAASCKVKVDEQGVGTGLELFFFFLHYLADPPPSLSIQGVPEIAQVPLASNLSSNSAFQLGPHFLYTAPPLPSAPQHGPGRDKLIGPSSLPSQPPSCCH